MAVPLPRQQGSQATSFEQHFLVSRDVEWAPHYLDYIKLKDYINRIGQRAATAEEEFLAALESSWDRFAVFLNGRFENFRRAATPGRPATAKDVSAQATRIAGFEHLNILAFLRIVRKHDRHSSRKLAPFWEGRLAQFRESNLFSEWVPLVGLWGRVFAHNGGEKEIADPFASSQKFERRSMKYWVPPEHVAPLLFAILEHLPVYVDPQAAARRVERAASSDVGPPVDQRIRLTLHI